jgi:hypothetical protein
MYKASGRDWRIYFFFTRQEKVLSCSILVLMSQKEKFACCLLLNEAGSKCRTNVIPNSKTDIATLMEWTAKHEVLISDLHIIMEATGV